ncbi:MAG: class III extradiol ring-cleavage dioxygenase [Burkholderiaceae bacterium]
MPLLEDPAHLALTKALRRLGARLARPSAIVVVSAHWEADPVRVTTGATPPLLYDYQGFAPQAYNLQYPAPGEPALAAQIVAGLTEAGIACEPDAYRGFDHGLFVPLSLMFPTADVPCVQVSLQAGLSAVAHQRIGEALGSLTHPDLLIVGSGFTFHNMPAFFGRRAPDHTALNLAFEAWLRETVCSVDMAQPQRLARLAGWAQAPGGRYAHPREEHLMPLLVCQAAARRPASALESVPVLGVQCSNIEWWADP